MRALLVLLLLASVAAARPKREPVTMVIAIDRSSAMDKASLAAAKAAALATAAAMDPADRIAVIGYDKDAEVDVPLQDRAARVDQRRRGHAHGAQLSPTVVNDLQQALK